jgi:hypothetical protein
VHGGALTLKCEVTMIPRKALAALLLSAGLTAGPLSVQTNAQSESCSPAIDSIDRDLAAFGRHAKDQNLSFIQTDVASTALSGIRARLAGNATADALFDLKERKEQFDDYAEHIRSAGVTMEDLKKCLALACDIRDFTNRTNDAIAAWIRSLGDAGTNAMAERVNAAASLVQGHAQGALSMAQGSALRAVENCTARFEGRVQAQAAAEPVVGAGSADGVAPLGAGAAPAPDVQALPGKRGSAVGAVIALGVAVPASLYAYKYWQDLQNEAGAQCGPEPSLAVAPGQSRPTDAQLSAMRAWCTCQGLGFGQGAIGFGCLAR